MNQKEQGIDMSKSELAICNNCGSIEFIIVFRIQVLSRLQPENPTGKRVISPIQVWQCCKCQKVYTIDEIDVIQPEGKA